MTQGNNPAAEENVINLTRLPVFDDNRRLWGYELFCVGDPNISLASPGEENVGLRVAGSAYMGMQHIQSRGKKIIINFNEKGILNDMPYALQPMSTVVRVEESVYSNPDAIESLTQLKSDKFLVAVSGFSGGPAGFPLYQLADIVCIDVEGRRKDALAELAESARRHPATIMATNVEDNARLADCAGMGFTLFSGRFFKTPEVVKLRKMSSNEVARFNLLRLIESEDPDFKKLSELIQSDVSISFRLLSYLNSAAFGFTQKIKSVHQAILLLGWEPMKKWLRVILITDMSQNKEAADLALLSAQRGKFLELLTTDHDYWGFDPNNLHLLGLFSLLDAMMGMPMKDIVTNLPLDAKIKSALCGDTESEYAPLLGLARLFEEAKWLDAEKMIGQLNLNADQTKAAFQRAVGWATELTTVSQQV